MNVLKTQLNKLTRNNYCPECENTFTGHKQQGETWNSIECSNSLSAANMIAKQD